MSKGLELVVWWPSRLQTETDRASGRTARLVCQVIGAQGRILSPQDLSIAELPRDLPVTLLVHPSDVSLLAVDVPDIKGKREADALAYAAEPHLLADIDDLFVSAHQPLASDQQTASRTVAAIERLRARNILDAAVAAGLRVRQLSCEPLFFDIRGRDLWLIHSADVIWVCSPKSAPWAIVDEEPEQAAKRLLWWLKQTGHRTDGPLLIVGRDPSIRQTWERASGLSFEYLGRDALIQRREAQPLVPERDMRAAGQTAWQGSGKWRSSARLGLATALCALVLLNLAAYRVRSASNALDAQVADAFQAALPNTPMLADPVLMLEQALRQQSSQQKAGGSEFTRLLHNAAVQLQPLPFNAVTAMSYDNKRLVLTFSVDVPEAQRRDIEAALRTQQMRGNWQNDEKKRARLTVAWGNQ